MNTVYCEHCGMKNDDSSNFCGNCGKKLNIQNNATVSVEKIDNLPTQNQAYGYAGAENNNYYNANQNNQNYYNTNQNNQYYANNAYQNYQGYNRTGSSTYDLDQNDLALFVGVESTGYYMNKYNEIRSSGSLASWNWAAFLIAGPWMLYRKMYVNALIFYAIALVSMFLPIIGSMISLALIICSGIFGNHLYFKYAEQQINMPHRMDEYQKQAYLRSKGGTSIGAAIGLAFAYSFAFSLIYGVIYAIGENLM